MRLLTSYAQSELSLGHLLAQPATSASRGSWRGSGFEATTQGWTTIRAAKGLLLSTSARPGTYGSAQGTQMGAAEALARLRAARDLGQRLGDVAKAGMAHPLSSFGTGEAVETLIDGIDPKKLGRHAPSVNGQQAVKPGPDGRSLGSDPVEAFAHPHVVLDTPSTAAFVSEASVHGFSGLDLSVAAQGDLHQTAGASYASVSGQTTSLYTCQGGIKAIAAHGPVSLRAHTDELKILADQDVTVVSVNDSIEIAAATRIELIAGQSSVVLEGPNITFLTPGKFEAKFSTHAFQGPASSPASPPQLPNMRVATRAATAYLDHRYHDDEGVANATYELLLADGTRRTGQLDAHGKAAVDGLKSLPVEVRFGPSTRSYAVKDKRSMPSHDPQPTQSRLDALVDKYAGLLTREAGGAA